MISKDYERWFFYAYKIYSLLRFYCRQTIQKNTAERNIQNYRKLLAPFIEYCLAKELNNVEDEYILIFVITF